jgi:hypothetical protein
MQQNNAMKDPADSLLYLSKLSTTLQWMLITSLANTNLQLRVLSIDNAFQLQLPCITIDQHNFRISVHNLVHHSSSFIPSLIHP